MRFNMNVPGMNMTTRRRKNSVFGAFLALAIGVVFIIIGSKMLSNSAEFKETGIPVTATVTNVIAHKSSDSTTFRPELQFQTNDGKTIQVVHSTGSNPPRYKVGDKVEIYYSPELPEHIMIESESLIFPWIFIILGGIVGLATVGSLISSIGRRLLFR